MKHLINLGLLMTLLTGCGAEIAYKRGASASDLQAGKAACSKAGNEAALEKCMEENGWMVQKLDGSVFSDDELFATASVTKDNRMTAPTEEAITTTSDIPTVSIESDSSTPSEPTVTTQKASSNSTIASSKATSTKSTPAKPKPSLMDTYVIKSWWKMGGNLTKLESHMDECRAQLGEAHYPDKKTFTFTRGFAICMRQHGWRGLVEKHR
jgi:hypothetical protein